MAFLSYGASECLLQKVSLFIHLGQNGRAGNQLHTSVKEKENKIKKELQIFFSLRSSLKRAENLLLK